MIGTRRRGEGRRKSYQLGNAAKVAGELALLELELLKVVVEGPGAVRLEGVGEEELAARVDGVAVKVARITSKLESSLEGILVGSGDGNAAPVLGKGVRRMRRIRKRKG